MSLIIGKKAVLATFLILMLLLLAVACRAEADTPTPVTIPPTATPVTFPPTATPAPVPTGIILPILSPSLIVAPIEVLEGGGITVIGAGFDTEDQITVVVVAAVPMASEYNIPLDFALGTIDANSSGAFSATFTLPGIVKARGPQHTCIQLNEDLSPPSSLDKAVWTVRAVGEDGGTASAPILVLSALN